MHGEYGDIELAFVSIGFDLKNPYRGELYYKYNGDIKEFFRYTVGKKKESDEICSQPGEGSYGEKEILYIGGKYGLMRYLDFVPYVRDATEEEKKFAKQYEKEVIDYAKTKPEPMYSYEYQLMLAEQSAEYEKEYSTELYKKLEREEKNKENINKLFKKGEHGMTAEEAKKAFDELRAQGETDEEILAGLYLMFVDGKFTVEELGKMAGILGYDLSDEFKAMSPEDQRTKGFKETDEK